MLHFLRHIRQKLIIQENIRKYLLYAIGEIMLVVIGILIALQVNNWNESRKEATIKQSVLENLLFDIDDDLWNLEMQLGQMSDRIDQAEYLLKIMEDPQMDIDSTKTAVALTRVGWVLVYTPTFATYNEILNSGRLSLIESVDLKKNLAGYYSIFEDSKRMGTPYDARIKEAEGLAVQFLMRDPSKASRFDGVLKELGVVGFDLDEMRINDRFRQLLKHISFQSTQEINYKNRFVIPRAERIKQMIQEDLDN